MTNQYDVRLANVEKALVILAGYVERGEYHDVREAIERALYPAYYDMKDKQQPIPEHGHCKCKNKKCTNDHVGSCLNYNYKELADIVKKGKY